MRYVDYGNTGLRVSRLCIGCGHFKNAYADPEEGGRFLLRVLEAGITFWDTAESYGSHPHVAAALRQFDRSRIVLQTKTGEKTHEAARARIDAALADLGTEYLDVILLHGVDSPRDLQEREGALRAMVEAREAGKVRVVGCSTHIYTGPVMDAVTDCPEIQVILTTVNRDGMLLEGSIVDPAPGAARIPAEVSLDAHLAQVRRAYEVGKGISIMKVIGGGKVAAGERAAWIRWGFDYPHAHAVNLGITTPEDLEMDLRLEAEQAEEAKRAA